MKAMILAAGFGSRLGAITQHTPKCLVQAGGKTLLEHTILRLIEASVTEITVNLHHLSSKVEEFLDSHPFPGIHISKSFEPQILETGGGVKASKLSLQSSSPLEPFLVHNADVYTTYKLSNLLSEHQKERSAATLLVQEQASKRGLLINQNNELCGWVGKDFRKVIRDDGNLRLVNFCGIQVCTQQIFNWMEPLGAYFSIIEAYLAGVKAGASVKVSVLPQNERWFDIGTPERLQALEDFIK